MPQHQRVYFDRKDESGEIITCFYDATKTDTGEIILGNWGELLNRTAQKVGNEIVYSGGRCAQTVELHDIIMERLPKTTFERHPFSGSFNNYQPKNENK